jgi:hypothetical protein
MDACVISTKCAKKKNAMKIIVVKNDDWFTIKQAKRAASI